MKRALRFTTVLLLLAAPGLLAAPALLGTLSLSPGHWEAFSPWAKAAAEEPNERIAALLAEIDPWIADDTTRIMAFIEQHNAATEAAISASPHWQPTLEDLGALLGIDYLGSPQIDATGRIYFQMRITGEQEALFYVDGPWGWPIQVTPNGWTDAGLQIGSYRLAPNGEYFYLRVMKYGDENWDIYRFSRDGKHDVLLEDRDVAYGTPHIQDDGAFFCSIDNREQMWIGRYDVLAGRMDTLYTEPGAFYPVDLHEGKIACIRMISFSESQLFEFDTRTGETRDLTDVHLFWSADYTRDGRILTLTDARSAEEEFMKLVLIDPAQAPVATDEMEVLYDPGMETDDLVFKRELGRACAILNRDGYSELVEVDLDGSTRRLPAPGVGIIDGAHYNVKGELVYSFSSPSTPPTAYYLAASEGNPEQIGRIATFGYDFTGTNVEVIHYESTNGTMIPALLYVPSGAKRNGSNPCIVEYHGGPPAQSRPYFQRNIAFALSRGVVFLFPNVRGSSGYGPAWERADNLENRFQALEDAEAALDYMFREGWSRPEKTAIWGGSYGGYTVNYLAVHAPEKFACAVSDVGVADVDWCNAHSDQTFLEGWEREMGPMGSELTRGLSPIFYADRITRPMLLTAGFFDPRVPASGPRRLVWVLGKLGKRVHYFEEVEAGHGASMRTQVTHSMARAYTFMFDHIL
ncbi:MAG: S9 family peptidase [Candidatus Eisenbacteria sp.]|nr:S9 family peptidase [Candidatus Eisenbacteria bacterium]